MTDARPWRIPADERGRTLVMGVVNVTPDSFSDGGDTFRTEDAIAHGLRLVEQGADLIDIGGESTRPGAQRTSAAEEARRVVPVVEALRDTGVPISVDTMRAGTAEAAVAAGAVLINDVSGGMADEAMMATAAELGVGYVVMHWRGHAARMQQQAHYDDVAAEVAAELAGRLARARTAGIAATELLIDPGVGFAKTADHNWRLLADLTPVAELGHPLLIGVSRKAFLGRLLDDGSGPRPPTGRDDASLALTTHLAAASVWAVRTHTVRPHRDAVEVVARLRAEPGLRGCSRLGSASAAPVPTPLPSPDRD